LTSSDSNNSLSLGPSAVHAGSSGTLYNPYAYEANSSTSMPPPPAAFVPSLKILKRPTNNPGSSNSNSQAARDLQKKSLKDRERAYHEARNRIFGANSESAPASATASGASSPKASALSPSVSAMDATNMTQQLASSIDALSLEKEKQKESTPEVSVAEGSLPLGAVNRSSNPGKQRLSSRGGGTSLSSTPVNSRPSTPSSTIIREPVNPPSSAEKNSSATVQMQARGFSKTKKKVILSPVAAAFVPVSVTAKPGNKSRKTSKQASKVEVAQVSDA
jgi:hypothetical protein